MSAQSKAVQRWLIVCCFMIFAMAVIGAITRLTESGLSITEWKPVTGALPPMDDAAWQRAFDLYRQSPEYADKHFWMTLSDFKKIYFWEWLHRLWGRLIGIVYTLPLIWFIARRYIPRQDLWKYASLLALGGAQGFAGWFMVQSGLVDRPSVSHFRLALHLGLALVLYSCLLWMALDLRQQGARSTRLHRSFGWFCLGMVSLTIVWGAFTAGLDAGLIYNTFPHMGKGIIPSDFGNIHSAAAGVQFMHRWLAIATLAFVLGFAWLRRSDGRAAKILMLMGILQVALGLSTLLTQVQISLAVLHQAGAIGLLTMTIIVLQRAIRGQDLQVGASARG